MFVLKKKQTNHVHPLLTPAPKGDWGVNFFQLCRPAESRRWRHLEVEMKKFFEKFADSIGGSAKWIVLVLIIAGMVYLFFAPPQADQPMYLSDGTVNTDPYGFKFGMGALLFLMALIIIQHLFGAFGDWLAKNSEERQQQRRRTAGKR